ncbi:5-formyltetrahydrofolate cyclo-ligase [Exiguobacterium sp. SH3S2]|uniref:5-formyltetrahydrofolate cyclo-ligase n=1 Tax=unclassified Exiguobacterium TaxID=2644629 RepID=UPI00103CAADB|nr:MULTISPECIES: 5-formyltetrahydrofolate cyclo-ligase [unclassified Exiguobacterium]TCI46269.1 5-formyltetrahydrofolate cyclo-ligase [Exiguobacterium sp. SH3S3]TCI61910.1 5-formyltetrahydrofolate cyclo-ligase [Exiguobacterium sp. SH3S2]
MTAKQELRKAVHVNIRVLTDRDGRDEAILHTVASLPEWQQAHTVALTLSLDLEVNTRPLIDTALKAGKSVLVPKVTEQGLTFHEIRTFSDLEPGVMGILEPTTAETDLDIDACIVPGRVFDRSGYRIGWGGGYYDRFLATYRGATIALAYDVQVLDEIPIEPHDIPVELIVTEREMIRCSQSSS